MFKTLAVAGALAAASIATTASATILKFDATSAQSDVKAIDFHSVWAKEGFGAGLDQNLHFVPAGSFVVDDDGAGNVTAELTGEASSLLDPTSGFSLSFQYNNDFSAFGSGPSFKDENGSAATQAMFGDNKFLNLVGGTLEGFGALAGAKFTVSPMPVPSANTFATQYGTGSNNKNDEFGLANWFFFIAAADCVGAVCDLDGTQGDININLSPVPVPAGLLLMGTALAGLGLTRRKKA